MQKEARNERAARTLVVMGDVIGGLPRRDVMGSEWNWSMTSGGRSSAEGLPLAGDYQGGATSVLCCASSGRQNVKHNVGVRRAILSFCA